VDPSHRTAIVRKTPSRPTQDAVLGGFLQSGSSILDWGCGRGADTEWLRSLGFRAVGYDPFYRPEKPALATFESALLIYVLNVIEDADDRVRCLLSLQQHLLSGAAILVAVRSQKELARNNWETTGDGFRTRSGTFQKGFAEDFVT